MKKREISHFSERTAKTGWIHRFPKAQWNRFPKFPERGFASVR